MAMLAEPRRKQRIGPNPRGKFFTEDEDNRGRHMLQKMGWSNGDGLGVERQGIREPIRPKIQMDSKGLGFDVKTDPWLSHNDDFNEVLRNLQAANGGTNDQEEEVQEASRGFGFTAEERESKELKHVNLESNSKASRSRIHYHKFVKNKDLSKIKTEDWNCIFGKPVSELGSSKKVIKMESEEEEDNSFSSELFINRGSLRDYFKCKRAQKFVKPEYHEDDSTDFVFKEDSNEDKDESHKKKKKKHTTSSKVEGSDEVPDIKQKAWLGWKASLSDEAVETEPPKKKKRKDKKLKQEDSCSNDAIDEATVEKPRKKKKNKNSREEVSNEMEAEETVALINKQSIKSEVADLVISKNEPKDDLNNFGDTGCESEKQKKRKKKKDRKDQVEIVLVEIKPEDVEIKTEDFETSEKFVNRGSMTDYFKSKIANRLANSGIQTQDQIQPLIEPENAVVVDENPGLNIKKSRKNKKVKSIEELETTEVIAEQVEPTEKFVNRGSMEDYFKSKMANRKANLQSEIHDKQSSSEYTIDTDITFDQEAKVERKRNKKNKKVEIADAPVKVNEAEITERQEKFENPLPELQLTIGNEEQPEHANVMDGDQEIPKKKKKKDKLAKRSPDEALKNSEEPIIPISQNKDEQVKNSNNESTKADTKVDGDNKDDVDSKKKEDSKGNFKKHLLTAEEYHETAKEFLGSNLLKIPGYRNQSSKFL